MDKKEQKTLKNIFFLVGLQIVGKVVNLLLNFLVARVVQKHIYGYANIQLQLYTSIILFYSKETVRKACQKQVQCTGLASQSAINMVILSFPLQLVLSIVTFWTVVTYMDESATIDNFMYSILLTCFSALLENLSEPFLVEQLLRLDMKNRLKAESAALLAKTLLTYVLIIKNFGLLAYAISQAFYCVIMLFGYLIMQDKNEGIIRKFYSLRYLKRNKEESNSVTNDTQYLLPEHKESLYNFTLACVGKFLLTEGEKILIVGFSTFDSRTQAEYSLVANLISLVCRFVFQPTEEAAFNLFSQLKSVKGEDGLAMLRKWLSPMLGIGACGIIFSRFCAYQTIYILYSSAWVNDQIIEIMRAYCIYLMFMGFNGISEAYAQARGNSSVFMQQQFIMFLNLLIYMMSAYYLSEWFGIVGLTYANCINMGVRATLAIYLSVKFELQTKTVAETTYKTVKFTISLFTHKYFIGLVSLGGIASLIAQQVSNHLIEKYLK